MNRVQSLRRVGISLGNIGALTDGLGEFAWQVGQRIAAVAPQWRQEHGVAFDFHLRDKFIGLFGPHVGYLPVRRLHRFWHHRPEPYALWHSLHQLNKNLPPRGSNCRVLTVHDLNYLYGRNAVSTWRHHRRTQGLLERSEHLVAISQHTAADVRKHLAWPGAIRVVLNGARSFLGHEQRPLCGWPAQPQQPFLFHLSRMSPSKNPQAIIALAKAWPQMMFVMAGPLGNDSRALQAATALPNVQFHLGIDDAQKAWAYANCAGFLFPSFTEGFGLPPIEAMHFGRPVFLSRLTCLPEVGGEAAEYFDDFSGPTMRAVVERGLQRHAQEQRQTLIQAHAQRFNWDTAASHYLALYRQLLGLPLEAT